MRQLLKAGIGLLALVAAAPGAEAADRPVKVPANVAPVFDWGGFHAGIHGGHGWGRAIWRHLNQNWWILGSSPGEVFHQSPAGAFAGGHVGVSRQHGDWVYGLEASLAWSGIGKEGASPLWPDDDRIRTRLTSLATLTGRVGRARDRTLLYVKAGLAGGRIKLHAVDSQSPPNTDASSKLHYGWTAGIGAETALAPAWVLGIEYNYIDLWPKRHVGDMASSNFTRYIVKADMRMHAVSARLSYRFATR